MDELEQVRKTLIDAIRQADRAGALEALDAWAARHGHDRLLREVLEPALDQIGDEWCSAERFTVAQVYVAGKIAGDVLLRIAERTTRKPPIKGAVILGNIEDDFHSLGRRIVATFLTAEGWDVHDLGNDVPPERFVDTAVELGARVIGVSAMMLATARNIRRVRADIDRRGLTGRIQLAVGGAVFVVRPELVREVGGDGTATNALRASNMFDALAMRSRALERAA